MPDLLEQGEAWLDEQRHRHRTVAVIYRRGATSANILATIGRTVFRQENAYGVVERVEARDYLIRAQDLVIDGAPVQPQAGDQVLETRDGISRVHEVMAPGGEPPWRFSDPYRRTYRIHTKNVGEEPAP